MNLENKNVVNLISLLKEYRVKKVIVSSDISNIPLAQSLVTDSYFEVHRILDERSAAYFATGLSFESEEIVGLVCESTAACRNYMSALTEAFYRNLPIVAIVSQQVADYSNVLMPKIIDNSISQLDTRRIAVNLPVIRCPEDEKESIFLMNKALSATIKKGGGPAIIILPSNNSNQSNTDSSTFSNKIEYYSSEDLVFNRQIVTDLQKELSNNNVAVLIGSHAEFSKNTLEAIENFATKFNAAILSDNLSNYHGTNKVFYNNIEIVDELKPNVVIDIGSNICNSSIGELLKDSSVWRVSENGDNRVRYGNLEKCFDCSEKLFFEQLIAELVQTSKCDYYKAMSMNIKHKDDLNDGFSYLTVVKEFLKNLPKHCSLHVDVTNNIFGINSFELDETINCSANVGGFGIDGTISTLMGRSMSDNKKLYFGLVGSNGFFYDINILGNRHRGNNLRILLINNENSLNEASSSSAKAWAKSMGIEYISAIDKESFSLKLAEFCIDDLSKYSAPLLLEVFVE